MPYPWYVLMFASKERSCAQLPTIFKFLEDEKSNPGVKFHVLQRYFRREKTQHVENDA